MAGRETGLSSADERLAPSSHEPSYVGAAGREVERLPGVAAALVVAHASAGLLPPRKEPQRPRVDPREEERR